MRIGQRRFRPGIWSVLFTAAGVSLFLGLGLWQLERAVFKESVELRFEQRLTEEYRLFVPGDDPDLQDIEYRKLILQGRYDNAHNFLVDNQLHQGRAGYYVLTPLQLEDSDYVILVNRGWAAWGDSRDEVEVIPEPVGVNGVAGIASFPSEPVLRFGGFELGDQWPQLIPYIDTDVLQRQFQGRLLPLVLWLSPERPGHYVRVWNPVWMRPEKSRAYATQWFAFAFVALVFFIILNLRKIE